MIKIAFLALVVLSLMGCETTPVRNTVVIEKKTLELVEIPGDLTDACETPEPPLVDAYMATSKDGREDMLVRYAVSLKESIEQCSSEKVSIQLIQARQRALIDEHNRKEAQRVKSELERTKP